MLVDNLRRTMVLVVEICYRGSLLGVKADNVWWLGFVDTGDRGG